MDNPGRLTKTGLLYEGNYDEWESRLWDTLKFLGADINSPFGKLENGTPVLTFIQSLVIPRLLLIIPLPAQAMSRPQWRKHLLPGLKSAAEPFKPMSLPTDVRTRIWKFTIASQKGRTSYNITADSPFGDERIHPVTRVSREVRAETLAIAWAEVRVMFNSSARVLNLNNDGEQFSSKCANRFHQLEVFEHPNRVSRHPSMYAVFSISEKGQTQADKCLLLIIPPALSNGAKIYHRMSKCSFRLTPLARQKMQSHLDFAKRLFGSSSSSTALAVMVLLGAPSLWGNLECERIRASTRMIR